MTYVMVFDFYDRLWYNIDIQEYEVLICCIYVTRVIL